MPVNLRYMVDDVEAAVGFYTRYFGFQELTKVLPAFADVQRGELRLLLSGPASSAGRNGIGGQAPKPGGWTRFQVVVPDIEAEVARLRGAGLQPRSDVVQGPGGAQVLYQDPAGNLVEVFEPASR
jgi:catechol 2,3-dioxygenase-like lactoylglutathione lyase family enzyme